MIENLFENIANRLEEQVEALQWIDLDYGQLEISDNNYPCLFPCALIDFPTITYSDETGSQQGLADIRIRIGSDVYKEDQDGCAQAPHRGKASELLQLTTAICEALQEWSGDDFTPLTRYSLQSEKHEDGLKVFTLLFKTVVNDDNAIQRYIN